MPAVAPFPTTDIMKADSGASRTYLRPQHQKYLQNIQLLHNGPTATLPNNNKIKATVPGLTNESLLSIGQLCDNGCLALFDRYKLYIFKNGKIILSGNRNLTDGLWDVPFKNNHIDNINYIVTTDKNKSDLARYLHACAFSPVVSTFQQCIKRGNFIT